MKKNPIDEIKINTIVLTSIFNGTKKFNRTPRKPSKKDPKKIVV